METAMLADLQTIFVWWLLLLGLGILSLPLIISLFTPFFDKGYAFSKVFATLFISYLVWLLGSFKLLPFSVPTLIFSTATFLLLNIIIFIKNRTAIVQSTKSCWKIILFEEFLFFVALATWSIIRGFQPDIRGLEKFMDFGFVNSILRSQYFPPADMWFAGEPINYYYFGHLITAVLTKLSGIPSHITYNLMIATLFAAAFTGAFSLGLNLASFLSKKRIVSFAAGLLSAILLTLGGNLHTLYWLITKGNLAGYWYPDATRFIVEQSGAADNTIHEFPIYSFVVADLHGHLINLPSVLLFLALVLAMFKQKRVSWLLGCLTAWLLGVFYMTNAWDFPIYLGVFGLATIYLNWQETKDILRTLWQSALTGAAVGAGALAFSLPFHLNFKNISKGIGLVNFHSPGWMLLVLWGLPLLATAVFLLFVLLKRRLGERVQSTDVFAFILLGASWSLVLLPEIVYVKDIYIHSYQRANTMFKFTYQAFVMFSVASAYVITRLATSKSLRKRRFLQIGLLLPIAACLLSILAYPHFAIKSYYGLKSYVGLSGQKWAADQYPGEYEAVVWLQQAVVGQPTILEAAGDSYTDHNLISAYTGLPTVQGWLVHEWLWRGSFDQPSKRASDVEKIYTGNTELLGEYSVSFVIIGQLEREKYPALAEEHFKNLGRLVFDSGGTKVYEIK